LLTYYLTAFHVIVLNNSVINHHRQSNAFCSHVGHSLVTLLLLANALVAEMPAQPIYTLLTGKRSTVKEK
jgi:hypothetical protein